MFGKKVLISAVAAVLACSSAVASDSVDRDTANNFIAPSNPGTELSFVRCTSEGSRTRCCTDGEQPVCGYLK